MRLQTGRIKLPKNYWNDKGDLVVTEPTIFRIVGWMINGGPNDGQLVRNLTQAHRDVAHGSFSPVYIQIGD